MYKVGFVILTWNSEKVIGACLDSIKKMDNIMSHVVVVDNGSTDDSVQIILDYTRESTDNFKCDLIKLEKNLGTTVSRNQGIKMLQKTDNVGFYCILDSDTEVNEESIIALSQELQNDSTIGIIGSRMHNSKGVYQVSGRTIPTVTEKILKIIPIKKANVKGEAMQKAISTTGTGSVPVGYLMSACWMIPSSALKKIGYLDEKIFYAPEDVDYCIRAWKAGLRVMYCYDADILHHWQRLSRKKLFSKHNFEHIKGLSYIFMKHGYLFSTQKFNIK